MSHTFESDSGTVWVYNGDLSGNVEIVTASGERIQIPGRDLLEFVAKAYLRPMLHNDIDDLSWDELLALGLRRPAL